MTTTDPELQLKASQMLARLRHWSLHRLSDSESAHRMALRLSPDNPESPAGMVQLLAVCGRRREALPFLFELIRKGEASGLLMIAARSSGAINDNEFLQLTFLVAPNVGCVLPGLALQAARSGQLHEHQNESSQDLQSFLTAVRLGPDLKTIGFLCCADGRVMNHLRTTFRID